MSSEMPQDFIPLGDIGQTPQTFFDIAASNPCEACGAPCCRMLLIPYATPESFRDLDYIRFMLGFNNVEMVISPEGKWRVAFQEVCTHLDQATNRCTVHSTPRQPKVCVRYSPYQCWYKRNFHDVDYSPELINLTAHSFEALLAHIQFDQHGKIIAVPEWEVMRAIVIEAEESLKNKVNEAPAED